MDKNKKPPKVLAVEEEYEESFEDVVRGFAEMKYSKSLTASALGMSCSFFRDLLKRYNLGGIFPTTRAELRPECKGVGHPSHTARCLEMNKPRITDDTLLSEILKHPTCQDFKEKAPFNLSTIYSRFGGFRKARQMALEFRAENFAV